MRERVQAQRKNLQVTMQRMQGLIRRAEATKSPTEQYQKEYDTELAKYTSMRDGGDGGKFRESEFTIRELHFTHWRDSDFQLLLEEIGETPILSDDEWNERFAHERSIMNKLFGKGGRPQ